MISETGLGLSVLIITDPEQNWQTFASWYSFYKNLPESKIAVVCQRNGQTPFCFYQWAKRIKVPIIHKNQFIESDEFNQCNWIDAARLMEKKGYVGDQLLIIKPCILATSLLDKITLDILNSENLIITDDIFYLKSQNYNEIINKILLEGTFLNKFNKNLEIDAKETNETQCLISCKKGCGKWINIAKGCPFSSANSFILENMTANEIRIIELWKSMVSLYNAAI